MQYGFWKVRNGLKKLLKQEDNLPKRCRECELLGICRDGEEEWKCKDGCMLINHSSECITYPDDDETTKKELLNGSLFIENIPYEKRILDSTYYVYALRYARIIDKNRYLSILLQIKNDISRTEQIDDKLHQLFDNYYGAYKRMPEEDKW